VDYPPSRLALWLFRKSVQPFFSKNCYACHSSKLKSGSLNLESYSDPASVAQDRDTWERVLRKMRIGEMPPKDCRAERN